MIYNRENGRRQKRIGSFLALLLCAALIVEGVPLTALAAESLPESLSANTVEEILAEEGPGSVSGNTDREPSAEKEQEFPAKEEADSVSDNRTEEPSLEEREPSVEEQPAEEDAEQVSENALDTISENTLETVSENALGLLLEDGSDAEREAMIREAQEAFAALLLEKPLMALLYHTDSYDVRSEADADSGAVATIEIGQTLYMQGVEITKQDVWYRAQYLLDGVEKSGYVQSFYLAYADEDWLAWEENYLLPILMAGEEEYESTAYGMQAYSMMTFAADAADVSAFPASYRTALRNLKNAHPNWTFVPMRTGLDFNTSVSKELGDKSLIQKLTSNVEKGWVGDPCPSESGWNYATKAAVAYHMDPRNFLSEDYIFQFEQLTYNASYHTEAAVQSFLNSTFMKGKLEDDSAGRTYARAFYEIGSGKKLSPIHLASRVYQEQGQGNSGLISGTYPGYQGYYNYFNVGVNGASEAEKIIKGLTYAKNQGWNTRYKSLDGGAATIGRNYILKYQDTIYLEKFNVDKNSPYGLYNHQYMQNIQAPRSESYSTKKMYANAGSLNSAFVFKIPVFENMPGETGGSEGPSEPEEPEIPLESISLDQAEITLLAGQTAVLYVTYTPQDTTDDRTVTWNSSDEQVVTVAGGRLTAVGAGKAVVTAKVGQRKAQCSVLVEDCTVTFMKQDGKTPLGEALRVSYGAALSAELLREKRELLGVDPSGSRFIGWYTAPNGGGSRFDETGRIHGNLTLYPHYMVYGSGFYVLPVGDQTYTGSAVKPKVQVYDGTVRPDGGMITAADQECLALTEGVDYTVSYKNNKKVNTAGRPAPTIVVKGKGNYIGTQEIFFNIVPKALTDTDITAEDITAAYSGKVIKKTPTVLRNGRKLVKDTDYTVTYPQTGTGAYQAAGSYPVVIKGKGGYSGTVTVCETITNKTLLSKVTVAKIPKQTYRSELVNKEQGIGIMPQSLQVTYQKQPLVEGKDYTVSYRDNMAVGTATATLTAVAGSAYTGSKSVTYKIAGTSIAGATAEGIGPKVYTGTEKDVLQSGYTLTLGGKALVESIDGGMTGDYMVSYAGAAKSGAVRAGTATMIFQGINEYSGQLKKTYKIQPYSLDEAVVGGDITLSYHTQDAPEKEILMAGYHDITSPYVKGGSKPVISVAFCGQTLVQGTDYTVSYKRNKALTTADMEEEKLPCYTIKGKGNFKGKLGGTFTITDGGLDRAGKVTMTLNDVVCRQKKNAYRTKAVLKDIDGVSLTAGKDYDKNLRYVYAEDAVVWVSDQDGFAEQARKAGETVKEEDIPQIGTVIRVTASGLGPYLGGEGNAAEISGSYRIVAADLSKVKVRVAAKSYQDGRPVTLTAEDLTLTVNGLEEPLQYGKDYGIDELSYVNNTKKGTAKVTLYGISPYGGKKTITYKIGAKILWW